MAEFIFSTSEEIYCIGTTGAKPAPEPKIDRAHRWSRATVRPTCKSIPADVVLYAGESANLQGARPLTSTATFLKEVPAQWGLPVPPLPKGAKQAPPALKGTIAGGKLTVAAKVPAQQGYVMAKAEGLSAKARVRVSPRPSV